MKLSNKTLQGIKAFSSINNGMVFFPGNILKVQDPDSNVFAQMVIDDKIENDFAIFDIKSFLNTVNMFGENRIFTFEEDHVVISEGKNKARYQFSNPAMIVHRSAPLQKVNDKYQFTLSADDLKSLQTSLNVNGGKCIVIKNTKKDGLVIMSTEVDSRGLIDENFNSYSIFLDKEIEDEFQVVIDKNLFNVIPLSYEVSVIYTEDKPLRAVRLVNEANQLEYRISLIQKSSKLL